MPTLLNPSTGGLPVRRDGHLVQAPEPHRLRAGDTNRWGGVARDGIVVGVSGALPWFDEAFAGCIAQCLRAFAKHRADATPGPMRSRREPRAAVLHRLIKTIGRRA